MSSYTGRRIVPKHCGVWGSAKEYEMLSIVYEEDTGDSYISRMEVPAGTALSNTDYWAMCGRFSEQMKLYQDNVDADVAQMQKDVSTAETLSNNNRSELESRMAVIEARQDANVSASTDPDADYAAEVVDARVDARGNTHASLGERIRNHELAFLCYANEWYYIASGTGDKTKPATTWNGCATGFIACDAALGDIILESANLLTENGYIYTITFYDHNKDFLTGFNSSSDFTVSSGWATFPSLSIPDGACYFRLSLSAAGTSVWVRFQYGGIHDEAKQLVTASEKMAEEKAYKQAFNGAISHVETPCGKNLFNTDSSIYTKGFLTQSGDIQVNEAYNYRVTGYIPVVPGKSYYYSYTTGGAYCCIYDAVFTRIDAFKGPATVEIPEDGCYVRLTYMPDYDIIFTDEENGTVFQEYCRPYDLYQKIENHTAIFDKKLDKVYGKNLFDKDSDEILEEKYLNSSGVIYSNSLYFISAYIAVKEGETYYPYNFGVGGAYHCIYASDKATIVGYFKDVAITIPEGGAYVRLSGVLSARSSQQFEKGSSYTGYESYTEYAPLEELRGEISGMIGFQPDVKLDKAYGKNLFNKDSDEIIEGKYLGSTGYYGSNSLYFISGFIAVEEGETYCNYGFAVGGAYHCIYASDKSTVVSGFKDTVITIPEGGAYVRLSGVLSAMSSQQFEKGDSYTGYESYTEYYPVLQNTRRIEALENNFGTELEVVLPETLYTCAGVPLSIYDENILFKSYHDAADIYCSLAERASRLMNFNISSAGSGTFEMVVTRGLNKVSTQDFSYETVDPSANNGKEINLLFIGDSFTDIGIYCKESKDLLEEDGAEVTLLGTCGNSTFKAEGLSGGTLNIVKALKEIFETEDYEAFCKIAPAYPSLCMQPRHMRVRSRRNR